MIDNIPAIGRLQMDLLAIALACEDARAFTGRPRREVPGTLPGIVVIAGRRWRERRMNPTVARESRRKAVFWRFRACWYCLP